MGRTDVSDKIYRDNCRWFKEYQRTAKIEKERREKAYIESRITMLLKEKGEGHL